MKKVIALILSLSISFGSLRHISFAEETQSSSTVQQKIPQSLLNTNLEEMIVKKAIKENPHIEARVKDIKEILEKYKSEENNRKKYELIRFKIDLIKKEIKGLKEYKFKTEEIESANPIEQIEDINNKLQAFEFEKQYLEILSRTTSKPVIYKVFDWFKDVSYFYLFSLLLYFAKEFSFDGYKTARSWLGIKSTV